MANNRLSHTLRVALAQINTKVGDLEGNADKIIANIAEARERGADVVVFPELAVTGYPPEDLLLKRSFIEDNVTALNRIARETKGITAIVGFVDSNSDIYNAAAILHDGEVAGIQHKFFLPNYGVFDEDRYFQIGTKTQVYKLGHIVFGVEVCEDVWYADGPHSSQSLQGGAHIVFDINSSPFHAGKWKFRETMLSTRAIDNSCAIVYLNAVGGQDELVFDGHSLVVGPSGEVLFQCKSCEEQLAILDIDLSPVEHVRLVDPRRRKAKLASGKTDVPVVNLAPRPNGIPHSALPTPQSSEPLGEIEEVYAALVLGTRDYVNKNGFKDVILGMSGGIDSALTACIACDALGPKRVRAIVMPSVFSSDETQSDAEIISSNLGIKCDRIPISEVMEAYDSTLEGVFKGTESGIAEENLQARIRGNLLMALSNKFGLLVLTTGNKSELSCGYSTLYGDMAGGFALIKDCPKTLVYELSRYRNTLSAGELPSLFRGGAGAKDLPSLSREEAGAKDLPSLSREEAGAKDLPSLSRGGVGGEVIPESIIDRPPSAELKPDQKDSDTLPPYDVLDPILHAYVEEDRGIKEIVAMGFDEPTVTRVVRMVDRNEYKRRQAAPGIKITPKAFGRDRRLPITNGYRE